MGKLAWAVILLLSCPVLGFGAQDVKEFATGVENEFSSLKEKLIARFQDEISSPPFSLSNLNSKLIHLREAQTYCGVWEFRFWLVAERERFRKELELDDVQEKSIERIKRRILDLRNQFRVVVEGPDASEWIDTVDEVSTSIEKEMRAVLTDSQMERLAQLEVHYLLMRYGSELVMALPQFAKANALSKLEVLLASHEPELEKLAGQIKAVRILPSVKSLLRQWLDGVVSKKDLKALFSEVREFGLTHYPSREIYAFSNLEAVTRELEKASGRLDAWGLTSYARTRPTGVMALDFEHGKDSAAVVFLGNVALDSSFANYLQLTKEQTDMAINILGKARREGWNDERLVDAIEDVLVPMQLELLEDRAIWREVEVFGFAPCVVSGRLGRRLGLSEQQREQLRQRASNLDDRVLEDVKQACGRRLGLVDKFFDEIDFDGEAASSLFGPPPKLPLFGFSGR